MRVLVEAADGNEPPEAEDDEATAENGRVLIDLLGNDTDPDGDGVRVESVSASAHTTAQPPSNGGVAYAPEANYPGTDRFTAWRPTATA